MLFGERSYLLAIDGERTNEAIFFDQWYEEGSPRSAALYGAYEKRIASKIAGVMPKVR